MFSDNLIEICAGSAEDVITACRFPVDRIELNSALELGGLTPSLSVLRFAKQHTSLPVVCMVRPRAAGFVYSETEFEIIRSDAALMLENGADGIVFGFLNPDHTVDEQRTSTLSELAHSYGREAVFHRAFDLAENPFRACEALIRCRIDRVLTSGQKDTALEGADLIAELIRRYDTELSILPGAGVNAETILDIRNRTGARQFHMTAKSMRNDCGDYAAVDARNIQKIMSLLQTAPASPGPQLLTREDAEMLEQEPYETTLTD